MSLEPQFQFGYVFRENLLAVGAIRTTIVGLVHAIRNVFLAGTAEAVKGTGERALYRITSRAVPGLTKIHCAVLVPACFADSVPCVVLTHNLSLPDTCEYVNHILFLVCPLYFKTKI